MVSSALVSRRSTISAGAFSGRGNAPAQPDPVTTALINKNSLQLGQVSQQIQSMTAQMGAIAGSLQVISNTLATSQSLERQREQQEQILQAKLAEQKLREGKESVIEKKIANAAAAPAQRIAAKAQFTLGNLGTFLLRLVGGWLVIKTVQLIKEMSEGNKNKLTEIKTFILESFSTVTNIFSSVTAGLELLGSNFQRIGTRLQQMVQVGLFENPVDQLLDFVKSSAQRAWDNVTNTVQETVDNLNPFNRGNNTNNASGEPTEPAAGDQPQIDPNTTPEDQDLNVSDNIGGPSLPQDLLMGGKVDEQTETNTTDGNVTSSSPMNVSKLMDRETGGDQKVEFDPTIPAEHGEITLQPTDTAEEEAELGAGVEGNEKKTVQPGEIKPDAKNMVDIAFNADVQSFVDTENYIGKTGTLPVSEMFSSVKKDEQLAQKVGPAPEPPVNIVPIPMEQQSAPPPTPKPVSSGGINNAPSYATSNADNIYTLGAFSNFNVLPA